MLFFSGRCEKKGIAMDIRQLREWGKRLFGSISANTKKAIAGVISAAMIVTVALVAIPAQAAGNSVNSGGSGSKYSPGSKPLARFFSVSPRVQAGSVRWQASSR